MPSVYEIVTNKITEKLEKGVIPWHQPWSSRGCAVSWKTQKPYRGVNAFLLESGEYATMKQINESGGRVKKGQHPQIVVFWKWLDKEDEETGEEKKIPMLRYYSVFDINTQVEGLSSKRSIETFEHDPIEEAEKIVDGYANKPIIRFASGRAYYNKRLDFISVPRITDYKVAEEYYSTLFHEMTHSTGHQSRLNREGITEKAAFGDETYSKEELVAEMGAAMLCGTAGIDNTTLDNSASYIHGWLRALKNDSRLIVTAASQAQKAADHILGIELKNEE